MKDNKIPSPLVSLLPVFVLILLLFVTIRTLWNAMPCPVAAKSVC